MNLNYLGFHKAVKKHDKQLPHAPCQQFYMHVLRNQPWVQGEMALHPCINFRHVLCPWCRCMLCQ